jgi:phage terminase large subunit GpA-like protein
MPEKNAEVICPHCGIAMAVEMPSVLSPFRIECSSCRETILPKAGDCCVICSHSELKCHPKQMENRGNWFLTSHLYLREGARTDTEDDVCFAVE